MRPYKWACRQTNFSEGEFRKESTPFSFYNLIFFYFIFTLTLFVPFRLLNNFLNNVDSTLLTNDWTVTYPITIFEPVHEI